MWGTGGAEVGGREARWDCFPWALEARSGHQGSPFVATSQIPPGGLGVRSVFTSFLGNPNNFDCSSFSVRPYHLLPAVFSVLPCEYLVASIRRESGQNPSYATLHPLKSNTAPDPSGRFTAVCSWSWIQMRSWFPFKAEDGARAGGGGGSLCPGAPRPHPPAAARPSPRPPRAPSNPTPRPRPPARLRAANGRGQASAGSRWLRRRPGRAGAGAPGGEGLPAAGPSAPAPRRLRARSRKATAPPRGPSPPLPGPGDRTLGTQALLRGCQQRDLGQSWKL